MSRIEICRAITAMYAKRIETGKKMKLMGFKIRSFSYTLYIDNPAVHIFTAYIWQMFMWRYSLKPEELNNGAQLPVI